MWWLLAGLDTSMSSGNPRYSSLDMPLELFAGLCEYSLISSRSILNSYRHSYLSPISFHAQARVQSFGLNHPGRCPAIFSSPSSLHSLRHFAGETSFLLLNAALPLLGAHWAHRAIVFLCQCSITPDLGALKVPETFG